MDRYTYTPNLLLNKRLTPPLSPSGRNPSLHPRIISHISRYTKGRERERESKRVGELEKEEERKEKEKRQGQRGGVVRAKKCMGSQLSAHKRLRCHGEPGVTKQRSENHMY